METGLDKQALAIAKVPNKNDDREVLACVRIGDNEIVATDSHILARYPIETKGDPILIDAQDLLRCKPMKSTGTVLLGSNGTGCKLLGDIEMTTPLIDATFPDLSALESTKEITFTVHLRKPVLKKLLACMGDEEVVKLEYVDNESPIKFTAGQTTGLLMPCRASRL